MMVTNNLAFFFRLIRRHLVYYLITVGGLTVGVAAFFFIVTYVGYEYSYDDAQVNGDNIYRVVWGSARTPVPLAEALKKEVAGVRNTSRVIFTASGSKFIVRDAKGNLAEENGYFADSTFFDVFSYNLTSVGATRPLLQPDQIVITQRMARKYFGDQPAVGKTIEFTNTSLRQKVFSVGAVMEDPQPNSQFDFDFLMPFEHYGSALSENWTINIVYTYILLEPDADVAAVQSQVQKIIIERAQLQDGVFDEMKLQRFTDIHFDSTATFDFGPKNSIENLWILSTVAALILLIAGINFINLSTARASDRLKEVSMKKILGATRPMLIVQFISEAIVIAMLSCAFSVLLVIGLRNGFETMTGVNLVNGWNTLGGYRYLLISFPFVVGLLAGIYPAIAISSMGSVRSLSGSDQGVRSQLRTALVVVQFSITAFLIISTAIIITQLDYIKSKDLGFKDDLAVILNVGGPGIGTRFDVAAKLFSENPNVISTSGTLTLPGDNTYTMPYSMMNDASGKDNSEDLKGFYVDHDFIKNMGIEVIKGRTFTRELSTDTVNFVLNEAAVKQLRNHYGAMWDEPVGQKLNYFRSSSTGWYVARSGDVIGVVKDFNFASLHHEIQPMVIQVDYKLMYKLVVRIKPDDIPGTIGFLEDKWKELNIQRPFTYQFLDHKIAGFYEREQKFRSIFAIFSALSIVISCIGLYGLVLYTTERRSREMSIRKVLGAGAYQLAVLVGSSFFKPVMIAFVIACPVAWYSMGQWLNQFAFKENISVTIFMQAGFLCAALAIVTVLSRVWKVSRANPVKYLKDN